MQRDHSKRTSTKCWDFLATSFLPVCKSTQPPLPSFCTMPAFVDYQIHECLSKMMLKYYLMKYNNCHKHSFIQGLRMHPCKSVRAQSQSELRNLVLYPSQGVVWPTESELSFLSNCKVKNVNCISVNSTDIALYRTSKFQDTKILIRITPLASHSGVDNEICALISEELRHL